MRQLAILGALAGLLAGCFGSAPPPPPRDHFYRLLVPAPTASGNSTFPGVVSVNRPAADALLRERPILFSASGNSHELQQHDYHFWTDPPPSMLQSQMVAYLRGRNIAGTVITPEMRIRPDFEVSGRIKRLERLLGGGPPRVIVEVELTMVRLSDGRPIVIDTFTAERPSGGPDVDASIMAMSAALEEIFEEFVSGAVRAQIAASQD
jgi:ABC-type uncharacterized transport system auxiliary subunit